MAKDNESNRYLRSTISNIAFLCLIAYAIHEKAFSETSLVVVVQLFITAYFGVRAVQNHGESRVREAMVNASNPRMQAVKPTDPPDNDDSSGPPVDDVYNKVTRDIRAPTPGAMPVPRRDDPSGGRGRYKRVAAFFREWFALAPLVIVVIGSIGYALLYIMITTVSVVAGLGGHIQ